jgi:hypothetical protein
MKRHLNVALALVAGLVGGLISRYIAPPAVMAQNATPVTNEVRAQSFVIVDAMGKTVATFAFGRTTTAGRPSAGGTVVLRDADGHEIWSAGGTQFRTLTEH